MRKTRGTRTAASVLLAVSLAAGCGKSGLAAPGQAVQRGGWGGDHVSMDVTGEGAALEFDCAHGRVTEVLTLDGGGRFDASGEYVAERPGPAREGDEEQRRPARYAGRVAGREMTLTVTSEGREIGSFTLAHGRAAVLRKCQ